MKKLLFAFLILFSAHNASAMVSPISVGIIPPLQLPPDNFIVAGARLSLLYGRQKSVYGFDFGVLGNVTYIDFVGIAVAGLFNVTHGVTTVVGLQAAGLTNLNTNSAQVFGVQFGGLLNFNSGSLDLYGAQIGLANVGSHSVIRGVQLGLYNTAGSVSGLQLGLLNSALVIRGVQIGLINLNASGFFKAFPIVNVGL